MEQVIVPKCIKCGSKMYIAEYKCPNCATTISGNFGYPNLLELSDDMFNFMLIFLKNRGNFRNIEKELGITYPTIRNRLDNLLKLLGLETKSKRMMINDILDKLESGKITAKEAEKLIKERRLL
ncbi:MAG: DUF2089 family protein [candidate division WOR-3 bacterium]